MATANISFRIDEDLKNRFEEFCDDVGMNMTTAFTMFMKATLQKDRLPFEVERDPFYSREYMEVLRRRASDMDAGKGTEHELPEVDFGA